MKSVKQIEKKHSEVVEWINYLVDKEKDQREEIETLKNELQDIKKKLHLVGRSVVKLYDDKK
jgi:archaellum component FlaC